MKPSDLSDRLASYQDAPSYQPVIIKQDITPGDLAFIASHRDQYPELETITVSRRLYPSDGYAMHVIGYVGEATEADIQRLHVTPGTLVGKSGLEQYYNSVLMGQDGLRRVIVDSRGRVEGEISDLPPRPGHDLRLTLDKDIQDAAEEAIGQRPGAIVALDPRNGEVLAMVSRPTFDPNLFTLGISSQEWQKLVEDPNRPLLNKAIQAQLAPGSVFKIVMSVAGLEEGIAETLKVNCQGGAWFYGQYKKCWISREHKVHGITDIRKAITQSCDVYFYTLGAQLGIDKIDYYAHALGLGEPTGIDLPHEAAGLVPSPAWKERHLHQPWFKGETINVAIGQGALTVTPLQLAHTIGGIMMDGQFFRPHLVFPSEVPANLRPQGPDETRFAIPEPALQVIEAGMRGVVGPEGTAASAHLQGVDWAARPEQPKPSRKSILRPPATNTSSWTMPGSWASIRSINRKSWSACCSSTVPRATTPPTSLPRSLPPTRKSRPPAPAPKRRGSSAGGAPSRRWRRASPGRRRRCRRRPPPRLPPLRSLDSAEAGREPLARSGLASVGPGAGDCRRRDHRDL